MAEIATWMCWGVVIVTWIAGAVYRSAHLAWGRHGPGGGMLWRLGSVVAAVLVYRPPGMT
jgi:hypothetical protein